MLTGYYQKNKDSLQKKFAKDIKILFKEEKNKRRQHAHEKYRNLLKKKKQKASILL